MTLTNKIQSSHHISFQHSHLHYPPQSPTWFLQFRFSKGTLYSLFLYYMHATCHIMYYVNNIWWTVTDMKLTTESSAPLYSYLPLTSNILLTPLLSQTLSLCSSLDVRHQISHPYTMTVTMSVLQLSTCNILNWTVASIAWTYILNPTYNKVTAVLHKHCDIQYKLLNTLP